MTKPAIYFIAIIFLFSSVYSCGTYKCSQADGLKICTISLTPEDIDTIILRKFTKGSGFTNKIDTLIMDSTNTFFEFTRFSKDTSSLVIFKPDMLIKSKYDYEIYIPAVNKLVKITEINEPRQKEKKGLFNTDKTYCVNVIQSYKIDGKTAKPEYNNQLFIYR
jgi:hypothetical protein